MYLTTTGHNIADEVILMNSIKSSWCTMGENILIYLAFLHFVQFFGKIINMDFPAQMFIYVYS